MTALLNRPAEPIEFPTLDLDQLDDAPLRPAVTLRAIECRELPDVLAAALPGVVHARRHLGDQADLTDEHQFIDTATGAAVRAVLRYDRHRHRTVTTIAESGPIGLWDRLVVACGEFEQAGRRIPEHWTRRR